MKRLIVILLGLILISIVLLSALTVVPKILNPYLRYTIVLPNDRVITYDDVSEGRFICGINVEKQKYGCLLMKKIKSYRIDLK